MEEMHMVRYRGKGIELPRPLQVPLSLNIDVFATWKLSKLILLGFVEASLHGHD